MNFHVFVLGTSGSIAVCISPLSLMMDQEFNYSLEGIQVEFLSEEQDNRISRSYILHY